MTAAQPLLPPDPLVEVRGVSKVFVGRRGASVEALRPIDLEIGRGEFLAVVGPSGCGKSTLLSIVAGLVPASAGEVLIDGAPIEGPYSRLGIVFQKDLLLEWRSVLDNVLIQAEVRRMDMVEARVRARRLLHLVGLEGFERNYPSELSGGMRQRVAICRALLHDPPLLLMDEPFAALDAITRDQMCLDLLSIWSERRQTVLFITHSIPEAVFLADRVAVMSPRPGAFTDVLEVGLERPRRLAVRETEGFTRHSGRIRELFEAQGILREART
ncbi:MAG TPA: ABC transporter ATP-binding protein [Candidatus Dormibacteraeota bacterium]|jgi:NitT/TauT family transport system ATP-binding protein|nr:ABC transporter ATP-binding protein [Candidatus Dormibacteraeota bacterium]